MNAVRRIVLITPLLTVMPIGYSQHEVPRGVEYVKEQDAKASKGWALVIGVDRYAELSKLNYAESDARAVGKVLMKNGWIVALLTSSASEVRNQPFNKKRILSRLENIAAAAGKRDRILVYFSGHGFSLGMKNYLCTMAYDAEEKTGTSVGIEELLSIMHRSRAQKRAIILDACREVKGERTAFGGRFTEEDLSNSRGIGHLYSTAPNAFSYEPLPGAQLDGLPLRHGYFTHFLLQGLSGAAEMNNDGFVTFREVAFYVATKLKEHRIRTGMEQVPYLYWDGGALHDILLVRRRAPEWAEVLEWIPDPKIVTNASGRRRMMETGLPWRVRDKKTQIEMLLVPPGSYWRGASPGDARAYAREKPRHAVTITQPLYLGRYEVTQAEFDRFRPEPKRASGADRLPANFLSWSDAKAFCDHFGFRLPTEAEWEYACRAGSETSRYGPLDDVAWHKGNRGSELPRVREVGGKVANPWGFHDMLGNAYEWCEDWLHVKEYERHTEGATDPRSAVPAEHRVCRGGSVLQDGAEHCRASCRMAGTPEAKNGTLGFRVARRP